MKRLMWISVGVGITIYALRKINQVNERAARFTPAGIASAAAGVTENVRSFGDSFRQSMKDHEARLTEALFEDRIENTPGRKPSENSPWDSEFGHDEGDPEEYF